MKRFLASSLVVCALLGIGTVTPAGVAATVRHIAVTPARVAATVRRLVVTPARVAAAVRHIPVNHAATPPLRTVEISTAHPTPTVVPPTSATACAGSPPSAQISSATCDPRNQAVRLEVLRIPAP